jgi:hypothetical protein
MSLFQGTQSNVIHKTETHFEISLYKDEPANDELIEQSCEMLSYAFPQLEKGFYAIFIGRIKDKKMTCKQLKDAVNHVIDTCVYPTPTIANFTNFDKKLKLYNYNQKVELICEKNYVESDFEAYFVEGIKKPFWILVSQKISS